MAHPEVVRQVPCASAIHGMHRGNVGLEDGCLLEHVLTQLFQGNDQVCYTLFGHVPSIHLRGVRHGWREVTITSMD